MTLVDDFYKQMEPSIKAFLDDNITIADKEEADRVYRSVKYYKKLNRLPPHLKYVGQNSIMKAQYGQLDKENWKEDISKGFEECMRVLKVGGTLVFKWSDCQVNVREVLSAIPFKPLFGQQRGTTHWMTFVKFAELTGNGR
ncbi:TPA: hypothetical protein ACXSAB_000238 [Streptococcus pyogenes]|uniref:hypothetical protein n=1 Tax=Streptococcus pyogenes TaxID=1314 RepID=UPI000DA2838F|nr:hypothetical protein [Streptococcus pyogenes]SQF52299.1 DNA N-4 cytosine methyltransferase M.NgoMXV [Streptococcus pyogenes]